MSNAQEHLEKAIEINPEFADAHYELALLLKDQQDFENSKVIRGKEPYDFYNLFHGPISDSLYHIGQVVAFRRASGNPIPRGVNHFLGIKM